MSGVEALTEKSNFNTNFWITANAGSGKTTQLVNRFLFLLQNGLKIDEIYCITYTKAGAKEMKDRIIKESEKVGKKMLDWQLNISTIHSLCHKMLEDCGELQKDIKILNNDEYTINKIIKQIINAVSKETQKAEQDKNFVLNDTIKDLAETESINDIRKIIESIIKQQNSFLSFFSKIVVENKQYGKIEEILANVDKEKIKELLPQDLRKFAGNMANIRKEGEKIKQQLKQIEAGFLINEIDEVVGKRGEKVLNGFLENNQNVYKLSKWRDVVFTTKDEVRKNVEKKGSPLTREIQRYYIEGLRQVCVDTTLSMLHFAYEVLRKYQEIKQEMDVITYDDILFQALLAIKNNKITFDIKYLMLDEAQDTNPISWEIIEAIAERSKCNFFVVGDKKQSIFRFQGARIEEYERNKLVFENLSKKFGKIFDDSVKLDTSFRSIEPILAKADELCNSNNSVDNTGNGTPIKRSFAVDINDAILHKENSEKWANEKPEYRLNEDKSFIIEQTEIEKYDEKEEEEGAKKTTEDNEEEEESKIWLKRTKDEFDKQQKLKEYANDIAKKIVGYVKINEEEIKNGIIDKKYNEIALIYPKITTQNGVVYDIINILKNDFKVNIKLAPTILKKHICYADLMSFFQFFILQNDDLNLACLLKSDFFNFTDKMLNSTCNGGRGRIDKNNTLWDKLCSQVLTNNEDEAKRKNAVEKLKNIILCKSLEEIYDCIANMVLETKDLQNRYREALNLISFGVEKYKNDYNYDIRGFLVEMETESFEDFEDFINQSKQKNIQNNETIIYVDTIHGVKGKEFDCVLLLDLAQKINEKNNSNKEEKMFFFEDCFWYKTSNKNGKLQEDDENCYSLLENIQEDKNQNNYEKWRLLYVAITRARRRFVYFGDINKSFYGKLFFSHLYQQDCLDANI